VHGPHVGAEVEGVVVGDRPGGPGGEDGEVVDELLALGGLRPGGGDPPHGGQQVRAYGGLRPGAAADRLQHAGEHLGGEVVGGVRVAAAGAGVPADCRGVPLVQLLVRAVVARPHPGDQFGVGGQRARDAFVPPLALLGDGPHGLVGAIAGRPGRGRRRVAGGPVVHGAPAIVPIVNCHAASSRRRSPRPSCG
jgi:hypothetical protein